MRNDIVVAKEIASVARMILSGAEERDFQEFKRLLGKLEREGRFFDDEDELIGWLGSERMPYGTRMLVKDIVDIIFEYPHLARTVPEKLRPFFDGYVIKWSV